MTEQTDSKLHSSTPAIQVAVVGHANTGKTSLIRTLLRNESFGEIADSAGTTRHVERAALMVNGEKVLELYDTPGLEDSAILLDEVERYQLEDSAERIPHFLTQSADLPELEQEAKVLRQGIQSDVLLYVVDVRVPLLEKFTDELKVLGWLGKPIIPVFNFIIDQEPQLQQWRSMMIDHNLHAALEFDTVAFNFEAEKRLYQKMQGVMEPHYEQLQRLIDHRNEEWQALCQAAARRSAAMLTDTACYHETVDGGGLSSTSKESLQKHIRTAEQKCLADLLRLFSFSKDDVALTQLPVTDGEWDLDLFSLDTLKMFGLDARSSALKGAAAGAGLDLMVGGLSLGVATTIGAIAGAGYSTFKRYGKDISSAIRQDDVVCADDTSMELLLLRQLDLLQRLTQRGHAAQGSAEIDEAKTKTASAPTEWKSILEGLRTGRVNRSESNSVFQNANEQLNVLLAKAII